MPSEIDVKEKSPVKGGRRRRLKRGLKKMKKVKRDVDVISSDDFSGDEVRFFIFERGLGFVRFRKSGIACAQFLKVGVV